MRKSLLVAFGVCVPFLVLSAAVSLEIRVAPSMLVLSSGGGNLTVHTNVPFSPASEVRLTVENKEIAAHTFADDRGFLVAQGTKDEAGEAIGDFEGKFTTALVGLTVDGADATETISELESQARTLSERAQERRELRGGAGKPAYQPPTNKAAA